LPLLSGGPRSGQEQPPSHFNFVSTLGNRVADQFQNKPPIHMLAELDHSSSKALAGLGQSLDRPSWSIILSGDSMNWDLVTEVAQLEC